jgi:hypothetical protein
MHLAVLYLQLLFLENWTLEADESLSSDDVPAALDPAVGVVAQLMPDDPLCPFSPLA